MVSGMKFKNIFLLSLTTLTLFSCATQPLNATSEQQYIQQITTYLNNNQSNDALNTSKTLIKLNSQSAAGYELQARSYQQLSQYDNAATSYQTALKLAPHNNIYRAEYAYLLCTNKQYQQSFNEYQSATNDEQNKQTTTSSLDGQEKVKNLAFITSSVGDCYNSQQLFDNAIESYETALQTKSAPQSTYIGITKAYLAQQNYPKAALYISSYPGNENDSGVIDLKLQALKGILNGNYSLSPANRKLLQTKIAHLSQKQAQLQTTQPKTAPVATIAPVIISSPTPMPTPTPVSISNSNLPQQPISNKSKVAPIIDGTATTKATPIPIEPVITPANSSTNTVPHLPLAQQQAAFKKRIQKTPTGKHYIVVEHGDTLFNISQRSAISQQDITIRNHLKTTAVPLGTKLYLD